MQEHRSCAAIRSWYRAQRVAARRDRNVEGTSSQCTLLHLAAVHWDIISSFYDVTSFAGQILIQGVIQDRKVELTSLQCTALHLLAIVIHVHVLAVGVL